MKKLIFVTGGVCSSLGKGIAASSLGALMEARGFNVRMVKIDPYLNVDAGTMSPYQHGEVYVTDDGAETDLDLGNYGRFTKAPLSRINSITTGQVYKTVIERERAGDFLGRTVQVIPHITDEIKRRILLVADEAEVDITIIEVGGTVGDMESVPFLEAARQLIHEFGRQNAISVHVTLVPAVSGGEIKTKPTQHAVKELQEIGIQPDVLVLRSKEALGIELRKKISSFTNVELEGVISGYDVAAIYELPLVYHAQGIDSFILKKMNVESRHAELGPWQAVVQKIRHPASKVRIGVVGKYMELHDAYKSVWEALAHGGIANNAQVELVKIDSSSLEADPDTTGSPVDKRLEEAFAGVDGILVPGGFGSRGIEGMVEAARYARIKGLPYFGICLGMQIMVIEYARNVALMSDAHSGEFSKTTKHPVVSLLEEQIDVKAYGGTMRLGASESKTREGSAIRRAYGTESIFERHRHRYEVSNAFKDRLEAAGLIVAATTPDGCLVEACEWPNHPWGLGVQFHPEFKSRPTRAHPLFAAFIAACRRP
ncbi:MAG: CTP synthase [Spirochaetia bacterium]|jgi:CTP synthase|nr:CTP synthase [Spirochaetia bacterium]MCE1208424.1 CTP synthase [Spirochaetia bacterium]